MRPGVTIDVVEGEELTVRCTDRQGTVEVCSATCKRRVDILQKPRLVSTTKVMNRLQLRSTESAQLAPSGLTQTKLSRESQQQQGVGRPQLHVGTFPWKGLKTTLSTAANHWRPFATMHFDVSRAHFTTQSSVASAGALQDKIRWLRWSMCGTPDAASNLECDWQSHLKQWDCQSGQRSKTLFFHTQHNFRDDAW